MCGQHSIRDVAETTVSLGFLPQTRLYDQTREVHTLREQRLQLYLHPLNTTASGE